MNEALNEKSFLRKTERAKNLETYLVEINSQEQEIGEFIQGLEKQILELNKVNEKLGVLVDRTNAYVEKEANNPGESVINNLQVQSGLISTRIEIIQKQIDEFRKAEESKKIEREHNQKLENARRTLEDAKVKLQQVSDEFASFDYAVRADSYKCLIEKAKCFCGVKLAEMDLKNLRNEQDDATNAVNRELYKQLERALAILNQGCINNTYNVIKTSFNNNALQNFEEVNDLITQEK